MTVVIAVISVLFGFSTCFYVVSNSLKRVEILEKENRDLKRRLGEYVLQEVADRLKNAKDYKIQ